MNFDKELDEKKIFFGRGWGEVGGGGGQDSNMYFTETSQKLIRHLNIGPKLYAKYQNPSPSSSQDIMLTKFFCCYKASHQRGITRSIFHGISSDVNKVI